MLSERQWSRKALFLGAVIVVFCTVAFFLLFFNRFAGVRTINGSALSGRAILAGRLPYRDWFSPAPPLHFLKNALLVKLFGTALIVPRVFALLERSLLALVLYFWLVRLFRISHAAFAAIVAIVVSAGDLTDPISSYNHDTLLFAVCSGFCASFCLNRGSKRSIWLWSLLGGIFAGLCFSTKQTIGVGITVLVPFIVAGSFFQLADLRTAVRFAAWFFLGWMIPMGAICAWLSHEHILGSFFKQIFLRGPAAKAGSPDDFIVRWLAVTLSTPPLLIGCLIALIAMAPMLIVITRMQSKHNNSEEAVSTFIGVFALAGAAVGAGVLAAHAGIPAFPSLIKSSIYLALIANGLLASLYFFIFCFRKLKDREPQFWLLSTVSFVCAFMLSLSWPAFEAMVMPGLGFLTAAVLNGRGKSGRYVCYAVCGLLLFLLPLSKLDKPFGFIDWLEPPVQTAVIHSKLPDLKGFRFPEPEMRLLEGATKIIREHTAPGETIFTYPTMPIFYALSGRWSPTYAGDHNVDACPDDIARQDAATLLRVKPAAIVYYRQDPKVLDAEEALWRGGKRSGQREIIAAIETLIKDYHLAGAFDAPPTKLQVLVYVRP